jgi:hypothetical protein
MTAALRKRLLPDADKFLAYNAVLAEFSAADKAADDAWRTLKSREEYDARRQELRAKMAEAVGGIDFERTPLNANAKVVVGASVKEVAAPQRLPDGFTILREVYSFGDGQKVPAVTFLPFANVVNGALLDYDWTDLLCAQTGREGRGDSRQQSDSFVKIPSAVYVDDQDAPKRSGRTAEI